MKTLLNILGVVALTLQSLAQEDPPAPPALPVEEPIVMLKGFTLEDTEMEVILKEYATLVGKTLVIAENLPKANFSFTTYNDFTAKEAKAFYETLLMQRNVAVVPLGQKMIQVIPAAEVAKTQPQWYSVLNKDELPDTALPVTGPVKLQHITSAQAVPLLTGFSKSPNSVTAVDGSKVLILRDSAINVKRMLEILEKVDVEADIDDEQVLIKIKYAMAADVASVLSTLTTSPLSGTTSSTNNRINTTGGSRPSTTQMTSGGTTSTGSSSSRGTLQQRLSQVTRGATVSGTGAPILGDTRVVSYDRGNQIMLTGKKRFLDRAKEIIEELDTVQKQVLIEAIIIDVALADDLSFGTSIRQAKQGVGGDSPSGGLSTAMASALGPAAFTDTSISGATGGFNYYGFLGQSWELALNAIKNDSRVELLSRPRIQTSHASMAELFIGETRPMITGTIRDISGGQSSQYQRQQIGITLEILPFINDQGLVVMDINQQIQDIVGTTTIDNNSVPITTDRQANAKVAVKDGEMIMLGGFIKTKSTVVESGVPILRDLPLLGPLFEKSSDVNDRNELIVLLRPTVMDTPEAAAAQAHASQKDMPGVDSARLNEEYMQKKYKFLIDARKRMRYEEMKEFELPRNPGNPPNGLRPLPDNGNGGTLIPLLPNN